MYADGSNSRYSVKPGSMMLALGVTALPIAGLIAATQVETLVRAIDPPIEIKTFMLPKDPPPDPPKLSPRTDPIAQRAPALLPPLPSLQGVPINPAPLNVGPVQPSIPLLSDPGEGSGTVNAVPILKPVLVASRYDTRYNNDLQPPYPAEEIRAGRSGRVVVRVLVGVDGRIKAVERVSAASDAFFAATERQALAKWRFIPATKDGIPIEQWKTMSLRFVLSTLE